jgi:IclR family transcriptional regulator, pca regulon regulatory protein
MPEPQSEGDPGTASGELVQSLIRGLAVIRTFDGEHPELTLSDVARRTGLSRAAAGRFLRTLEAIGYVRTDGRLFSLRPRLLELGQAYLASLSLPELAQPHLDTLVAQVGESASMAVLDGTETISVARSVARGRILILANTVGTRFPAYAGAMGRVLLAAQPAVWLEKYLATETFAKLTPSTVVEPEELRAVIARVREQGYSFVNEELGEGLRSCAVPIRNRAGEVVAAINISVHFSRLTPDEVRDQLLPALREASRNIEDDFHAVPS